MVYVIIIIVRGKIVNMYGVRYLLFVGIHLRYEYKTEMINDISFNPERMLEMCNQGHITATDIVYLMLLKFMLEMKMVGL